MDYVWDPILWKYAMTLWGYDGPGTYDRGTMGFARCMGVVLWVVLELDANKGGMMVEWCNTMIIVCLGSDTMMEGV